MPYRHNVHVECRLNCIYITVWPITGKTQYIKTTVHLNNDALMVAAAQGRGGCHSRVVFFWLVNTSSVCWTRSKRLDFILTNQCAPSIVNYTNSVLNYGGFLSTCKNKKRGNNSHIPDFPLGKVVDVAVHNGRQFELPSKWNNHCCVPCICFCTSKLLCSVFPTPFVE